MGLAWRRLEYKTESTGCEGGFCLRKLRLLAAQMRSFH